MKQFGMNNSSHNGILSRQVFIKWGACHWLVCVCFLSLFIFNSCDNSNKLELYDELTAGPKPGGPPPVPPYERVGYWESWDEITLHSGQRVNVPWHPLSTTSDVPIEFLHDICAIDGWKLVYYKLDDGTGSYTGNSPYLIFHNRYTGILKVFCYLPEDSFSPNNHGVWGIKTESPSSLFAFQNTPITPIGLKEEEIHYVSNLTNNHSHGFSLGWNCFQIELAYDPSQSGFMYITTVSSNEVTLNLTGELKSETKGLMATSKGTDNYRNGIAKIAGEKAGDWIEKKVTDKSILGIPSSLLAQGVKAVVTGGVGSILGAVTGLFKKDDSTKSLQLTTNGTFSISGEAEFESTTGIESLHFNIDPSITGYFGVWGLEEEPTLLFSPYAVLKSPQDYTNGYTREYLIHARNGTAGAAIKLNPALNLYLSKTNVTTDYYQSDDYTRRDIWGRIGVLGRDPLNTNKLYDHLYKPNMYIIADVAFKGDEGQYLAVDEFEAPMETFIPNVPSGPNGALPEFHYNSKFMASIGVHLTLRTGSEASSYHRVIPKIDWDYSEYDNGLYWYFYPCVPVSEFNYY